MSKKKIFVTENGVKLTIKSLPQLKIDQIRNSTKYPKPPQYAVTTAAGEIEYHDHDETTLQTAEDKAAWAKYKADTAKASALENERIMKLMFTRGVDVEMEGEIYDAWLDELVFLGIELPTNKLELKYQYITGEVLASMADLKKVMGMIMTETGVNAEVVEAALSSFPDTLPGKAAK